MVSAEMANQTLMVNGKSWWLLEEPVTPWASIACQGIWCAVTESNGCQDLLFLLLCRVVDDVRAIWGKMVRARRLGLVWQLPLRCFSVPSPQISLSLYCSNTVFSDSFSYARTCFLFHSLTSPSATILDHAAVCTHSQCPYNDFVLARA